MVITIVLLFGCTVLGGLAAIRFGYTQKSIHLPLIFAGSYLFSITILHILPEVFTMSSDQRRIGLFVLIGFFFQQFLEHFTSGVEHGHFHEPKSSRSKYSILIALIIHSLMEGSLLTHNSPFHGQNNSYSLLIGIILHKAPAAFALMAVYKNTKNISLQQIIVLLVFSIASPIGMIANNYILNLSPESLYVLFAFVSGVFLHISTTIFVESSPGHHFKFSKIIISLLGALLAIVAEYFI
jgi:zinc transporter ZupT